MYSCIADAYDDPLVAIARGERADVVEAIHKVKPILLWDKLPQHVPSEAIHGETARPPLENALNSGVTREVVATAGIPGATAYQE